MSQAAKINVQEQVSNAVEQAREAAQNVTSKVTDFFQGNPFETEVGKRVELATDADKLATDNWALNMEICDIINNTEDGGRNAVRAIRKRLQMSMGKNNGVVMYTLTVLETCIKNCDQRFKALVCQKEFINELVRLISAKFDAPQAVQERVLSLIQAWADAFRGHPALSGVAEVYDELKSKGVEFPATDFDQMAPIITPKRTVFPAEPPAPSPPLPAAAAPSQAQTTDSPAAAAAPQHTDALSKLRSDVDVVTLNITVLRDLLTELTPGQELPDEIALLTDLHKSLKEMQQRIVTLISAECSDDVTFELITVNEELNNVFDKYDRHVAKRSGQPAPTPETEDNRQLRDQLDSFGIYDKDQPGPSTTAAEAPSSSSKPLISFEPEAQLDGLRTIAYEKPMLSNDDSKAVDDWLGEGPSKTEQKEPPKKEDDGL